MGKKHFVNKVLSEKKNFFLHLCFFFFYFYTHFFWCNILSCHCSKNIGCVRECLQHNKPRANPIKQVGATYGPRRLLFELSKCIIDLNLARETQIKTQCGPRTKIVARPCYKRCLVLKTLYVIYVWIWLNYPTGYFYHNNSF